MHDLLRLWSNKILFDIRLGQKRQEFHIGYNLPLWKPDEDGRPWFAPVQGDKNITLEELDAATCRMLVRQLLVMDETLDSKKSILQRTGRCPSY